MATAAAANPGGRVSGVFRRSAERQGAYDFIESKHVEGSAILHSVVDATNRRAAEFPFVFVPMDGTSLHLADEGRVKDFGSVGSRKQGARGLKIVDAIAVAPNGTPLGLSAMQWWARGERAKVARWRRTTADKELQHWIDAVDEVAEAMKRVAPGTRAWFQIDREGDAQHLLGQLATSEQWYTVRSQSDRRLSMTGTVLPGAGRHPVKRRRHLRGYMGRKKAISYALLEVPARGDQEARVACVALRAASVVLPMVDKRTSRHQALPINVVWVREHRRGPVMPSHGGMTTTRALDWMLLTNHPIDTLDAIKEVVRGYEQRWRIEDFHRAWKTGVCNVEDSQLRAREHVIKWATVLAAVAIRAERIKHLSRETPRAPATVELSPREIEALILLKRRYRKKNEEIADQTPDLETATRWIAELGGYTGKSSGGPPGATTIARGLAQLHVATEVLDAVAPSRRSD
jgi:hypothetical protein